MFMGCLLHADHADHLRDLCVCVHITYQTQCTVDVAIGAGELTLYFMVWRTGMEAGCEHQACTVHTHEIQQCAAAMYYLEWLG